VYTALEPNPENAMISTQTPLSPMFDTWAGIAGLYQNAAQQSAQQLFLSSASIIQEHTLRAFMAAAQSCADALAKNALNVQQQSMARFAEANQQAMGMVGTAFIDAWSAGLRPPR
jgi:hypothetical protein